MKYLGFLLKSNDYRASDWLWLVKKIEKQIGNWVFCWLSLGGRLVLLKYVLQNISVYWLSLVKVLQKILHKIRQVMFHFLWLGAKEKNEFHMVNWEQIYQPKELGVEELETYSGLLQL